MATSDLGPWEPLSIESLAAIFAAARFRWWVCGGHALELHLGSSWREHEDTDVGIARADLGSLQGYLADWDLQVAADGRLTPWKGQPLELARNQNNLWCRLTADGPWVLDVLISEGTGDDWIYRRNPAAKVPWGQAVLHTHEGIPYLAPELQLLYKSTSSRTKDEVDAAQVIPTGPRLI